jgi:hypothetical protein
MPEDQFPHRESGAPTEAEQPLSGRAVASVRAAATTARECLNACRGGDSLRFLLVFLCVTLFGIATATAALLALKREGLLPAPPIAGTGCIDEKLLRLRDAPLADRTLLAVGSSATWRNLDLAVLERRFPGTRAFNAAPCYLHVDQTAFLAEFLLPRAPRVDTLLVVLAPRDFEACPPEETDFLEPSLAGAFLSGWVPDWLPYLTGFRPVRMAREVLGRWREQAQGGAAAHSLEDAHGSSILLKPNAWRPEPSFDPRCDAGLARLEEVAAEHGARLVVATLPTMPEWAAAFDPDGAIVEAWTRRMADTLSRPDSVLIDGRALRWDDSHFADPMHVIHPHHTAFTEFVAEALARAGGPAADVAAPGTW